MITPRGVIDHRTLRAYSGETERMIRTKRVGRLLALTTLNMSPLAIAGKKLEIDDTRWISIGVGARGSFTSQEDSSPSGEDRNNDFTLIAPG